MKSPKEWLKGGLEHFGMFALNKHATAQVNNERDTLTVQFIKPDLSRAEPGIGAIAQMRTELLHDYRERKHAQATSTANQEFFRGMRELAQRLRTQNRLQGVTAINPDPKYPNPYFTEPLTVRDFFDRFGSEPSNPDEVTME